MRLCFVGGGKMAEALLGGLIETGWADAGEFGVVEVVAERRSQLGERFPAVQLASSVDEASTDPSFSLRDVVIAVKPQHIDEVLVSLAACAAERALSIAAGVTLTTLTGRLGEQARVIRAMPNTPALVGAGAAAVAGSVTATDDDLAWAASILDAVGTVDIVDEADLDAVTGVSGSGPAYLFLLAEAMTAAGIAEGLTPALADQLTRQTLFGAAKLLAAEETPPATLRANVSSPGGTTVAAIDVMQERGLEAIVGDAISAATRRSRELGRS